MFEYANLAALVLPLFVLAAAAFVVLRSLYQIGPTEQGLVTKRLGLKKLTSSDPIARNGECGFQKEVLRAGLRFKLWPVYSVRKYPIPQIASGEIGLVFAQVGAPLPQGAKTAPYKPEFGNFSDIDAFVTNGGYMGVQQLVLSPGTLAALHPVAFLVVTRHGVYGEPIIEELNTKKGLTPADLGIDPARLVVTSVQPAIDQQTQKPVDICCLVTAYEGAPVEKGDIASRMGGYDDIRQMESDNKTDAEIIEVLLGTKNTAHNNFQDVTAFLANGGRIGLQHDPLLYGNFTLNPVIFKVEQVPMLVVRQGEVAVITANNGLPTIDTSGAEFKFGSLVRPGHRGIWREPLRTGKYPLNTRIYRAEIVPTSILTLNWAQDVTAAHKLDANLSPIKAKSREGFEFSIDLQVQIHIPDTQAARVISMVGNIAALVNEVLGAAVGNHFRNTLQSMAATEFIQKRKEIQEEALQVITTALAAYNVETRGVYIQDVVMPQELVAILQDREKAEQNKATYAKETDAERARALREEQKGLADQQAALAASRIKIDINQNNALARKNEGQGEADFTTLTGEAQGKALKATGEGSAAGYTAQVEALGQERTALVAIVEKLAAGLQGVKLPEVVVLGNGGSSDGLLSLLMRSLAGGQNLVGALGGEPKPTTKN